MTRIIVGLLIVVIGLSALIGFNLFKYLFAIALILIGIRIITKRKLWNEASEESVSGQNVINDVVIFSEVNKVVKADNFIGGKIVLVFAGGQIDLSHVKTTKKVVTLEIVCAFAGGKLIVPKDWHVDVEGTAVAGGYENKTQASNGKTAVLNLKGVMVFGGLEIVN